MSKPKATLIERVYVHNQITRSLLAGTYYFVAKAEVLSGGMLRVVGKKVDVTESIQELLKLERARAKRKAKGAK